MATRITVVGLRRQLLQRPGITATPRCPTCHKERTAADLDTRSGVCWDCVRKALALARIDVIDARLRVLWQAQREITDHIQLEMIDQEMSSLEGERMDLWFTECEPGEASRAE